MLRQRYGLQDGTPPTPVPLSTLHIPQQSPEAPPVILNSLANLVHTNRLATGQVLPFGVGGITIIYGDNGSGKSGYCRILKKLCRVREGGEEDIRGNAFDAVSVVSRPEATVRFTVGGGKPVEVRWKDPSEPPEALSRISVFDAKTASLYADQQNRIEFLPHALDTMTRLGEVCERLGGLLDVERAKLEQRVAIPLPAVPPGTEASTLLARLAKGTLAQDLPSKEVIEAACVWTDQHAVALNEAEGRLLEDPEVLGPKCQKLAQMLGSLEGELQDAASKLGDAAVDGHHRIWQGAKTAREAAVLAAAEMKASDLLPGFGSDAWRLLFQYAKDYSTVAYPGETFPVTRDNARCVLCQQPLGAEAVARFATFDAYVKGAAEAHAAHEELARDNARSGIDRLTLRSPSDSQALMASLAGEEPEAGPLTNAVNAYLHSLAARKKAAVAAFASGEWDGMASLSEAPLEQLAAARARLEAKAASYDVIKNQEARKALQMKAQELHARRTVSASLPAILRRREDLDTLSRLLACKSACDTKAISRNNTDLRKKYLTKDFESRLTSEVQQLDLGYLPFKIQDRSDHGASYLGVGLEAAVKVRNRDVLSDGEFRALAIACFLTEVNSIAKHNGIVIDDPVSSLDSHRTRHVARRLVTEARKGRQVIVFTHDLIFYHELRLAAAEQSVQVVHHWIRRTSEFGFGTVFQEEEPWQAKRVSARLGDLEQKVAALRKVSDRSGDAYREKVKDFYSDLRETWERLVEDLLLNGVVTRFQLGVETQSLKGVRVDDGDYRRVYFGMKRASEYSGHDKPMGAQAILPSQEDIAAALAEIRSYADELKKRNKKLEDDRRQIEKPIPGTTA